jgi:hypothetical protein
MEKEICECKRDYKSPLSGICELCWDEKYPDEKETIEEAAQKYVEGGIYLNEPEKQQTEISFYEGAKWQQERMYSEEEVLGFGKFCVDKIASFLDGKGDQTDGQEYSMEELFDQFKKK